jgi:hypothetical protein
MAAAIAIVSRTVIFAAPAAVATISYGLTGDTNNLTFNGNNDNRYTIDAIALTDATTALNQLPGFTLNLGDTLKGTPRL